MTNLDENVKNPLNVNKYNLLKVVSDTTGLTESEQFDVLYDLNEIVKEKYEETVRGDIVAPHVFDYDTENSSVCYVLGDDFYKEALVFGLNELNIKHEVINLTDDFLNLKLDIECNDVEKFEEFNEFFEVTEDFKMSHINFDKVFEKLADKGVESLTVREKAFLDNQ